MVLLECYSIFLYCRYSFLDYWRIQARRVLRDALLVSGRSRAAIAVELRSLGVPVSEAAIANRLCRGTVTLDFLLSVAAAQGMSEIRIPVTRPTLDLVALAGSADRPNGRPSRAALRQAGQLSLF